MHWSAKYVGLAYEQGGRGPLTYDCWGLVQLVYQNEFGIALPSLPGISAQSALTIHGHIVEAQKQDWSQVEVPFDGCAVAMSQGRRVLHHVGVYLDAGRGMVLHCWEKTNAIADPIDRLRWKGFHAIQFYRHCLWPS